MKLLQRFSFQALIFTAALVLMQSCGCSNGSVTQRMDRVVNDDDQFVITGDIARALEQLDIEVKEGKLVLPEYIMDLIDNMGARAADQFEERLDEFKGLDYTSVVVAGRMTKSGMNAILSLGVSDADALYDFIEDTGANVDKEENDGYVTIGDRHGDMLVKDGEGYMVMKNGEWLSGNKAIRELENRFDDARQNPLAAWKKDYLAETSVFSYWVAAEMIKDLSERQWEKLQDAADKVPGLNLKNMSMAGRVNLEGDALKGNITVFSGEKVMKTPFGENIDSDLLKYTNETDMVVLGGALNNKTINMIRIAANKSFDEEISYYENELRDAEEREANGYDYYDMASYCRSTVNRQKESRKLFNNIADAVKGSGIVAYGIKANTKMEDLEGDDVYNKFHFVAAVKCKSGSGKKMMEDVLAAWRENVGADSLYNVTTNKNGYVISVKEGDMKFYMELDGDNFVVSNESIENAGKCPFDKDLFKDAWLAGQVIADADIALLKEYDLPSGLNAKGTMKEMSLDYEISFPGSKKKFVPTLVEIIENIRENIKY